MTRATWNRTPAVEDALRFAEAAHSDDPRKRDGTPYVEHTAAAAELVARTNLGEEAISATLLHDAVESTPVTVDEIDRRFGPDVARLVEAMTEDRGIDSYVQRKRALRSKAEAAGRSALAIYAADRVTNIRATRAWYEREGEAVDEKTKVSLDVRMQLWQEDLEMLARAVPDLPYLGDLEVELRGLRADRAAAS
jgi:(p)ppGpp synthase/HD superfamily hydrolase